MTRRFGVLLAGAAMAALVLAVAGVATAQGATKAIRCDPSPPKACKGTPADDTITGSARADNIFALGGSDLVDGGGATTS